MDPSAGKDVKMPKPAKCLPPGTHVLPNRRLTKAALVLAAILSLGVLPASAQAPSATPPQARTLSVDGSAEVHVVPDTALVTRCCIGWANCCSTA